MAAPLLNNSADVEGRDSKKRTPLHIAAGRNSVKAAKLLLSHCAIQKQRGMRGIKHQQTSPRKKTQHQF